MLPSMICLGFSGLRAPLLSVLYQPVLSSLGPNLGPARLAVLTGVALLVCIVAALIWPPRCKPGDRVVIGETLLLGR